MCSWLSMKKNKNIFIVLFEELLGYYLGWRGRLKGRREIRLRSAYGATRG